MKLLILDDEEVILESLKLYLERKGYSVLTAQRGEIALSLLKEHNPDLMLLDLHLKEGPTGIEVLKQALAFNPQLKVAVLTGFGKEEDVKDKVFSLGAKLLLKKPIQLNYLKEELDKLALT